MKKHGIRLTWSSLICGLAVLGIVLAAPGITLAKKGGGGGGKDTSQRVHYFVWYSPDTLSAFTPSGPFPDPTPPIPPYDNVAGGCVPGPDDPKMVINPMQANFSVILPGVSPFSLAADGDVDDAEMDEMAACFPSPDAYEGTHGILTDADGTITVQMHLHGLSFAGRKKYYNLLIDVYRVTNADGNDVGPAPGWDLLDIPQGETYTLYFGQWELRTGTGRLDKGCHAFGNLSNDPDEETAIKVRRFTQEQEDEQRTLN